MIVMKQKQILMDDIYSTINDNNWYVTREAGYHQKCQISLRSNNIKARHVLTHQSPYWLRTYNLNSFESN